MNYEQYEIGRLMKEEEAKAWKALSGYKFWMFGYHAAAWVKFNCVLRPMDRQPNPFKSLVKFARNHIADLSNNPGEPEAK